MNKNSKFRRRRFKKNSSCFNNFLFEHISLNLTDPTGQILASIEEDVEEELPMYRLVGRELLAVASCLHTSTGFLILLFMLLMGMAHSVVSTAFYWYVACTVRVQHCPAHELYLVCCPFRSWDCNLSRI